MGFSADWDERYRANTQMSVWPFSDLVAYVKRYAGPLGPASRVLELGVGAGANIPFFKSLGVDYRGVEGSPFIVAKLHEAFPELKDRLAVADFTRTLPFDGPFDLVADRSSLTHATTAGIRSALGLVHARLKPGGAYIGIDWFSTAHADAGLGRRLEDDHTRVDIESGQFRGVGQVHFSDRKHIEDLFQSFKLRVLEHKTVDRELPAGGGRFAAWNFFATKEDT